MKDRRGMSKGITGGGGGTSLPGVTGDGNDPAGLTIAGDVHAGGGVFGDYAEFPNGLSATNANILGAGFISSGFVDIGAFVGPNDARLALGGLTVAGPPSGTHYVGELWFSLDGHFYLCSVSGNPATWITN